MSAVQVGRVLRAVQVRRDRGREAGDDFLAGDESVPLVVSGRASCIGVRAVSVVASASQDAALVFCSVNGDFLACDVPLPVQVVPGTVDQDDAVADEQRFVAVLDFMPLKLICLGGGGVAEGVVCHAAGHRGDVASSRGSGRGRVVTPRPCRACQNGAVVVEPAELDGSEKLRHKVALLPFL